MGAQRRLGRSCRRLVLRGPQQLERPAAGAPSKSARRLCALPAAQIWGIPKEASEAELAELLEQAGAQRVHSVAFDPKQETAKGKVAFVRFPPPPLPWLAAAAEGGGAGGGAGAAAPPEADVLKIAEGVVNDLRGVQPELELHGEKLHVEKTQADVSAAGRGQGGGGARVTVGGSARLWLGADVPRRACSSGAGWRGGLPILARPQAPVATSPRPQATRHSPAPPTLLQTPYLTPPQVSLFLANLKGELNEDERLREHVSRHGAVVRCFVVRNPNGESKVGREGRGRGRGLGSSAAASSPACRPQLRAPPGAAATRAACWRAGPAHVKEQPAHFLSYSPEWK